MKRPSILLMFFIIICLISQTSQACTTFSFDQNGQSIFGKNYDWHLERGLVMINKRGVSKTALENREVDPGPFVQWTSKYGSLTFNQYGRELPMGGINEAGLAVEVMSLKATECPAPDSRPAINLSQWVQYQLDNFGTVRQVIASDSQIRTYFDGGIGIHFLAMDRQGNCAVIEFLNGKMVYHTKDTLPVKALTNNTYTESMAFLKRHKGFGGDQFIPYSSSSFDRFVRAANMLKNHDPKTQTSPVDYAFDILANVANPVASWGTKWSIVYDVQNQKIYFRTFSNKLIRHIDFHSFDFSCQTPVKILDMDLNVSGDVTHLFQDYTRKMNLDLIRYSFKGTYFLRDTPNTVLEELSKYPETTQCN